MGRGNLVRTVSTCSCGAEFSPTLLMDIEEGSDHSGNSFFGCKSPTQKQYISGSIKFLEKKFKNIEMLKESKRNESGTWYSDMKMGHL